MLVLMQSYPLHDTIECNFSVSVESLEKPGHCRCSGKDVSKAAQWYYDHLSGKIPLVVLQGRIEEATGCKQGYRPDAEAKMTAIRSVKAESEEDELLDMLLNLGIDSSVSTAPYPAPTATSSAADSVPASRQGVRKYNCINLRWNFYHALSPYCAG